MEIKLQSGLSSIVIAAASHIKQHSSMSVIMKLFLALWNKGKISRFSITVVIKYELSFMPTWSRDSSLSTIGFRSF